MENRKLTAEEIFDKNIGINAELGYVPITNEDVMDCINEALQQSKQTVEEIFSEEENLKITGFKTPAEFHAYQKGRDHEQSVIMDYIKKWDGHTNSVAGQLLKDKLDQLQPKQPAFPSDVDIILQSSHKDIYVNDQQRIGYQRGAKWMQSLSPVEAKPVTEKWISVEERLPEPFSDVIIAINGGVDVVYFDKDSRFYDDYNDRFIYPTHWQSLPDSPVKQSEIETK